MPELIARDSKTNTVRSNRRAHRAPLAEADNVAWITQSSRGAARLDPRIKLLFVLGTSTLCLLSHGELTILLLLLASILLASCGEKPGLAVRFLGGYLVLNLVIALVAFLQLPGLTAMVVVLGFTLLKFIPVFLLAAWFIATTRIGELIAALERMHIPKQITIPVAVMLRYLPTIRQEFTYLKGTMKLRGISFSLLGCLRQPLRMLEYICIPLLMRCLKVADELAASATTRGIEHRGKRSSIRDVRIRPLDWIAIVAFLVFAFAAVLFDQSSWGDMIIWKVSM